MTALCEYRQLFRSKRGMEPGQILVGQEKIVLIDNDADVGVGAQTGVIRPQITGFFHRFRHRRGQAPGLIIRNRKLLKIILVGILEDFLIDRFAPEIPDRVLQDSLIIPLLTAVNNIPQRRIETSGR